MAEKKSNEMEKIREVLGAVENVVEKNSHDQEKMGSVLVRRQIGKQIFLVRVFFLETGKEGIQEKLCRLMREEAVQNQRNCIISSKGI